jgi:hypothetical protein
MAPVTGLTRWSGAVAAACVLSAVALLPPAREFDAPRIRRWQRPDALEITRAKLSVAERALRLLSARDSLLRLIGGPQTDDIVVLVESGFPAAIDTVMKALLASVAGPVTPPEPSAVRTAVAVVAQTPQRRYPYSPAYLLPEATDGRTCLAFHAVLGLTRSVSPRQLFTDPIEATALGPCAYFRRFGMPSAVVSAWLAERRYVPLLEPWWLAGRASPTASDYRRRLDRLRGSRVRPWGTWRYFPPLYFGCAGGDDSACVAAVTGPPFRHHLPSTWPSPTVARYRDETRLHGVAMRDWGTPGFQPFFTPPEAALLSDLVIAMGPDRFQRFWTSDAPSLEAAFKQAFGVGLADWMMGWTHDRVGVPRRSPAPQPMAAAGALLIAGACVTGAGLWASRRRVG